MFSFIISFILGLLMANAVEWFAHKYILHGLGKKKNSLWRFHWHSHHRIARKHAMADISYKNVLPITEVQSKEAIALLLILAVHIPFAWILPGYFCAALVSTSLYYYVHRKSHIDPQWGKKYLPWHYDHHMGKNQDANWCVTWPGMDYLMGTRVKNG